MCFEFYNKVEYVENPDTVQLFQVFKGIKNPPAEVVAGQIKTAAQIYLRNNLIHAAFTEAEKYERKLLLGTDSITELPDRAVVFASLREKHYFNPEVVHPDQCLIDPHVLLEGTVIVLQLKDFSFVAQYSFGPSRDGDSYRPEVLVAKELRIKLNLDSESGTFYHRSNR